MAKCFIITPYGKKKDANGKIINFDKVFNALIEKVVTDAGLEPIRSDKDLESGLIFKKMIQDIATAEVCIADITTLNPNVFYELGVRHSLCRGVTILIRLKDHPLPFDISNLRVFAYGPLGSKEFEQARKNIVAAIAYGRGQQEADSLVYQALPELSVQVERPKPIGGRPKERMRLKTRSDRYIGVRGGSLAGIDDIPVWVNSENTEMQMSRYYEPTISGTIRYEGAQKGNDGRVVNDVIADELGEWMHRHNFTSVVPGTVIRTSAGELTKWNVKFVLHVGAVHATPRRGYRSVDDLPECVTNVLRELDRHQPDFPEGRASLVMPLLGTGSGGSKVEVVARELFSAALDYLETTPETIIETVWFLAYSEPHWAACMRALHSLDQRLLAAARANTRRSGPAASRGTA